METKIGIFNIKYSFDDDTINITTIDNDSTIEYTEQNNALIIRSNKSNYITEEELLNTDLTHSEILTSEISDDNMILSNKTKYNPLFRDILKTINRKSVQDNFPCKEGDINKKNYNYCSQLNLSFKSNDSNCIIKKIIKAVKLNNYNMDISIKLENDQIINFKI
tara:strand:+ start:69 stop:560 length:492 start_codon:yes stop_codon:yes gene_type:complete